MATRSGVVSKSATKAPRAGVGREEKRGISTILFRRSGSIGAFVADLDNPPPQAGRAGRSPVGRRPGARPDDGIDFYQYDHFHHNKPRICNISQK